MTAVETVSPPEKSTTLPTRVQPPDDATLEQIQQSWKEQDEYINYLEEKILTLNKTKEERNRAESTKREQLLIMRLTAKEQEIQEMNTQLAEIKATQSPSSALLRSTLLDPAVNLVIDKLTKQCDKLKKEVEEKDQELVAWKFTPDSASGKRLMARCRQLHQENEDLGRMIASGKLSKLESELALQKNLTETFKQNEVEMEDFIAELDEDVEGLQSTVVVLQQQLKEAKDEISKLNVELGKDSTTASDRRASMTERITGADNNTGEDEDQMEEDEGDESAELDISADQSENKRKSVNEDIDDDLDESEAKRTKQSESDE